MPQKETRSLKGGPEPSKGGKAASQSCCSLPAAAKRDESFAPKVGDKKKVFLQNKPLLGG